MTKFIAPRSELALPECSLALVCGTLYGLKAHPSETRVAVQEFEHLFANEKANRQATASNHGGPKVNVGGCQ